MELNKTLLKIKLLMEKRQWSMYRLSKETGIPYSSLNSLFQKNNQPTLATLEKLCEGLDITMEDFFSTQTNSLDELAYFSKDEQQIITLYRSLSRNDKQLFLTYLKGFAKEPI